MLEEALNYAAQGWKVFPVAPQAKHPLTTRGFLDASSDPATLRYWWTEWPRASIGLATGAISSTVVVDVDKKHDGYDSLARLEKERGGLPRGLSAQSGGGGLHLFFKHPMDRKIKSTTHWLGYRGIDIRADGGYVILPPSLHESGQPYRWMTAGPPAELPAWALAALSEPERKTQQSQPGAKVGEGGRNQYLMSVAGKLQAFSSLSDEAKLAALHAENQAECDPPLDEDEVEAIAKSAGRYPEQESDIEVYEPVRAKAAGEYASELLSYLEDDTRQGQTTCIAELDKLLGGGFRLGEFTGLMAEAGKGKSTFFAFLIRNLLELGIPVGYASREMSPAREVLPQILTAHLGEQVLTAKLSDSKKALYKEVLSSWPLHFTTGFGAMPFEEFRAWVLALKEQGVSFFFFDHLHFSLEDSEDFKLAVKYATRVKALVQKEGVHLAMIIQPTKVPEGMSITSMGLNALRGGAGIGQTLDNLLILEGREVAGDKNIRRLTLKKGRSTLCELGELHLKYHRASGRFQVVDITTEDMPESDYDRRQAR